MSETKKKTSSVIKIIIWLIIVVIIIMGFMMYWHHGKLYPSTDDTYVNANIVHISPQVSGNVSQIYAENYQNVKKGQKLLQIDPRPFQIAIQSAQAQLAIAKQEEAADAAAVIEAQSELKERQADLELAKNNSHRIMVLVKDGQQSAQQGDQVTNQLQVAQGADNAAQQNLQQALAKLGQRGDANANVQSALATLNKAKLDLSYASIHSPVDGILVNYNVRSGNFVQAGEKLFSIVDTNLWWVDANFKEDALERIRSGQTAKITLAMYPGHTFTGSVYKISPGSGSAFSILPPENATGNWVKVTQRFPVKIIITDPVKQFPLRVGASATAEIDTTHQP